MFKYQSTVALFSVIVAARETFEVDFQAEEFDASGENMIQTEAAFTIHYGDSFEIHVQMAHHPNGYNTAEEKEDRQKAWDEHYVDHSYTPTWMLPKFVPLVFAVRTSQGVIRLTQHQLQYFDFIKINEPLQRIVEDEWVWLWTNKEPRNARD